MPRPFATFTLALTVLLAAAPPHARADSGDYPRLGLYGNMMGNGYPLWDSTGTLQATALDEMARYHEVILDISPITPYRPDALAALRARRPDISLLAYVTGSYTQLKEDADSLNHFPTLYNHTVRNLGGFLYNKQGQQITQYNVNLAKKGANGHYVVAEALADLFYDHTVKIAPWSGIFIDIFCEGILWIQSPTDSIDYVRAGYPTLAAFDASWKVATDTLANRLRRNCGSTPVVLVGNCATGTKYASFDGWMRENFPYQQGGSWYTNMYWDPGGYFADEAKFRAPTHNYIYSAAASDPYGPTNARKVRFGLGSAALGSGYGAIGPSDRRALPTQYQSWWFDEYAVDLATGMSSTLPQNTGWLGQPMGPAYQMIWVGTLADAVTNPGFETDVTSGWTMFSTNGSSVTRDATTSGVGAASAHIAIPSTTSVPWAVSYTTLGTVSVTYGADYAATFWAKAATPREIRVVLGKVPSGEFVEQTIALTTSWKQYQVALIATGAGIGNLSFFLGTEAGDVWLDDCHLQRGATSIFRRDFQNGSVLVNPSSNVLTVPLERTFHRISGVVDPLVNSGASVTQVTVDPSDGLFLIGTDLIPPSAINDLRRVP